MAEGKLFVITGFGGGVSIGIQADSPEEFRALARGVFGDQVGDIFYSAAFSRLATEFPDSAAANNLAAGGLVSGPAVPQPAAAVAPPVTSTVGQPLPQPSTSPAAPPPGLSYPGNCAHGVRTYKDSMARGKQWRRWECAVPWSRGVTGRCDPINVEG